MCVSILQAGVYLNLRYQVSPRRQLQQPSYTDLTLGVLNVKVALQGL